jgi:hypothetical protein
MTSIFGRDPRAYVSSPLDDKYVRSICPFPDNLDLPLHSDSASSIRGSAAEKLLLNNVASKKILGCLLYVAASFPGFASACAISESPNTVDVLPNHSEVKGLIALKTAISLVADSISRNEEARAKIYGKYLLGDLKQVEIKDVSEKKRARDIPDPLTIASDTIDERRLQKKARALTDKPGRGGFRHTNAPRRGKGGRKKDSYASNRNTFDHYSTNSDQDRDDREKPTPRNPTHRGRGRGGR